MSECEAPAHPHPLRQRPQTATAESEDGLLRSCWILPGETLLIAVEAGSAVRIIVMSRARQDSLSNHKCSFPNLHTQRKSLIPLACPLKRRVSFCRSTQHGSPPSTYDTW